MCLMNGKPVNCSPCVNCPEYLNSCMPVVVEGFLGECDLSYCEFCSCYEECMTLNSTSSYFEHNSYYNYESEDFEYETA